jgi:hypothetical protein|tara:strand:+ start:5628 stop:5963 length:336 start_codon:yes stop_codon:yes gene_type:complete
MPIPHRFLPETATIQTVSDTTVDERGLPSASWANTYTNVKCKFESLGAEEDREGRNTTVESFNVFIEKGISVTPGDRLKRGSNYHEITFVQPLLDRYGVECYKMLQTFVAK